MRYLVTIFILLFGVYLVHASTTGSPGDKQAPALSPKADAKSDKAKTEEVTPRGQLLYLNHCTACHESNVHIRHKRKVRSKADLNKWILKWATYRKLDWDSEEINSVGQYLNGKYYKFKE